MPSQSHGRVCVVVALCFVAIFLLLKIRYDSHEGAFTFAQQYTHSGKTARNGISNDTLGFEKIFVINAPWRTDRKDSISLAASYSGISLDWIEGINASEIQDKAYPPGKHRQLPPGNLGSWRAHLNAMREIILQNFTTALILEDDADWDFRVRTQLADFSYAARKIPFLAQQTSAYTKRNPPASEVKRPNAIDLAKRSSLSLPPHNRRSIPPIDPYGREWDVLWLGHCGAEFPPPSIAHPNRLLLSNDPTVPLPEHLRPSRSAPLDPIASLYPPRTRIYHRTSNSTLCTLAYAVTQTGARKILYQFGIKDFSKGYDFALSDYCNGGLREGEKRKLMCVTVQPPLFSHFWSERGKSDIMGVGAGGSMEVGSRYVRRSVRASLEGLVRGEGFKEQWADNEE